MAKLELTTLDADANTDEIVEVMKRDGAAILRDVIGASTIASMLSEVKPYVEGTPMGGDDFTGRRTQRTGALIARTPTCRELVVDPAVLAAAKGLPSASSTATLSRAATPGSRSTAGES